MRSVTSFMMIRIIAIVMVSVSVSWLCLLDTALMTTTSDGTDDWDIDHTRTRHTMMYVCLSSDENEL